MRAFFGILTTLLCIATPSFSQEAAVVQEVICEGQINFGNDGDNIFVVVTCNDPFVTEEQVLGYARGVLDSIGFEAFTGIKSAIPFGPAGPIDADTSPNWALVFFIPINA